MDPASTFQAKNLKEKGWVVVGLVGRSLPENLEFLGRVLGVSVSPLPPLPFRTDEWRSTPSKMTRLMAGWDAWPSRNFHFYMDEENQLVYVLLSVRSHSEMNGFSSPSSGASASKSRNGNHQDDGARDFQKDSVDLSCAHELTSLKAMLLLFLVCHVILFVQDFPRLDFKCLQYFRWLKASKFLLLPFLKTLVPPSSASSPSSLSSSSATFYPSSSAFPRPPSIYASALSPSSASFRPNSPAYSMPPYAYPSPWNPQLRPKLQSFPIPPNSERPKTETPFNNQISSPQNAPLQSVFPPQFSPTVLFIFPYKSRNADIDFAIRSNKPTSSDSAKEKKADPSNGEDKKSSQALAEASRKKLQASLEAQVRYLLKKCDILTHNPHISNDEKESQPPHQRNNSKTKYQGNSNSPKEESSGLFTLDSSRAVALVQVSDTTSSCLDALANVFQREVELGMTLTPSNDQLESILRSSGETQAADELGTVKIFIQRQVEILRGKVNQSHSPYLSNHAQVLHGKGESPPLDKPQASLNLPSFSSWVKHGQNLSSAIQSKELVRSDALESSSPGSHLDSVEVKRKASCDISRDDFPSGSDVDTKGIVIKAKDAINSAVGRLSAAVDLDTTFSSSWCQRIMVTAIDIYNKDLPSLYVSEVHLSHYKKALEYFQKKAKRPAATTYVQLIQSRCDAIWKNGRQKCEATSLTRHHCIHPLHIHSKIENPILFDKMRDVELSLFRSYLHSLMDKGVANLSFLTENMNKLEDHVLKVKEGLSIDSHFEVENSGSNNDFHCSNFFYLQSCACGSCRFVRMDPFFFPLNDDPLLSPCCKNRLLELEFPESQPLTLDSGSNLLTSSSQAEKNWHVSHSSFKGKTHFSVVRLSMNSCFNVFRFDDKQLFNPMTNFSQPGFIPDCLLSPCSFPFISVQFSHSDSEPISKNPFPDSFEISKQEKHVPKNVMLNSSSPNSVKDDLLSGRRQSSLQPAVSISNTPSLKNHAGIGAESIKDGFNTTVSKTNTTNNEENGSTKQITILKPPQANLRDLSSGKLDAQMFPSFSPRDSSTNSATSLLSTSPSNSVLVLRRDKMPHSIIMNSESKVWNLKNQIEDDKSPSKSSPFPSEKVKYSTNTEGESSSFLSSTDLDYPPLSSENRKQEKPRSGKQKDKATSIIFSNSRSFKIFQHESNGPSPKSVSSHAASDPNDKFKKVKDKESEEKERETQELLPELFAGCEHECCQGHRFFLNSQILKDTNLLPFDPPQSNQKFKEIYPKNTSETTETRKDDIVERMNVAGDKDWKVYSPEKGVDERVMVGRGYRGRGGRGRGRGRGERIPYSERRPREIAQPVASSTVHSKPSAVDLGKVLISNDLPMFLKCPYCLRSHENVSQTENRDPVSVPSTAEKQCEPQTPPTRDADIVFSQLRRVFIMAPERPVLMFTKPVIEFEISRSNSEASDTYPSSDIKVEFSLSSEISLPSSNICIQLPFTFHFQDQTEKNGSQKAPEDDRNVSAAVEDDSNSKATQNEIIPGVQSINSLLLSTFDLSSMRLRSRLVANTLIYTKKFASSSAVQASNFP